MAARRGADTERRRGVHPPAAREARTRGRTHRDGARHRLSAPRPVTTLTNPFRRRRHPRSTEGTEPDAPALRRVRWLLLLWSGGSTLVLLVALGVPLAVVTADSLRRSVRLRALRGSG